MDKETLEGEINELMSVKQMVDSELFQKFILKPMKDEKDKLKTDFFSDSIQESYRKGGKQQGIDAFLKLVESVTTDLDNKRYELGQLKQ